MKWVELLKEYDGKKIGTLDEFDDAIADTLVKVGTAKAATEPPGLNAAAEAAGKAIDAALESRLAPIIDAQIVKSLDKYATNANKRPGISITTHDNVLDDPKRGFKYNTEFYRSAKHMFDVQKGLRQGAVDERLRRIWTPDATKAPTTYSNEGSGSDGGFSIPPDFLQELLMYMFSREGLLGRCAKYTTTSNNMTIPRDETTPWGGTGIQTYWSAEASQATQSKIAIGQDVMQLEKTITLCPVTDEMLSDSFIGLGAYLGEKNGERMNFAVDEAIVNGTGAGQPQGFLNSGALVTPARTTSSLIKINDIGNMISVVPSPYLTNCMWLVHPSAYTQLLVLANANSSLYIGPGEVDSKQGIMGRLLGIPLLISQHCQYLGTTGDIMLVDFKQYLLLTKGSGIESAMSIHLWFDYDVTAFRFIFRVAGQPWMKAPITAKYPASGAGYPYLMSPFVALHS